MSGFSPRWVAGKTVDFIETNPRDRGDAYAPAPIFEPIIWFTDGSSIAFWAGETNGDPGVEITYRKAKR